MKNYKYIGILVLAWLFTLPATAQLGEERHNFCSWNKWRTEHELC